MWRTAVVRRLYTKLMVMQGGKWRQPKKQNDSLLHQDWISLRLNTHFVIHHCQPNILTLHTLRDDSKFERVIMNGAECWHQTILRKLQWTTYFRTSAERSSPDLDRCPRKWTVITFIRLSASVRTDCVGANLSIGARTISTLIFVETWTAAEHVTWKTW